MSTEIIAVTFTSWIFNDFVTKVLTPFRLFIVMDRNAAGYIEGHIWSTFWLFLYAFMP
jgi:hypothetical protein